jgi:mannose-6-phosphate isomerase-like protein (cupin superfamily)
LAVFSAKNNLPPLFTSEKIMHSKREEIAARVRELRDCRGIAALDLAKQVGATLADYEKMEKGTADFPASMLCEIASALRGDLTALLTGREANMHEYCVTRNGQGVAVSRRADYGYQNLAAHFLAKKCEPFLVTVPASNAQPHGNSHHGQEFNYVLVGKVKIIIHHQEFTLEAGDSIYFDATQEHAMQALDGKPAQFLAVIV